MLCVTCPNATKICLVEYRLNSEYETIVFVRYVQRVTPYL